MNAPLTDAASAQTPPQGGAVLIDLTESVVRAVYGGAVVEWPTTVGYLDPQSADPNQIVAGEPIARTLGANPLSGVRLLPTLVDVSHILLNNRPHAVGDLLTRLLAPALPAKVTADDPEILVAHPSTWGGPRAEVLRSSAAKLGAQCSLIPRSVALSRALANRSGRTVAVIEAQASSVDISLLTNRNGDWTPLESRRLSAQMGISLAEMGVEVARELSGILQEETGKSDCSKALDGLIIDAPPRLAEAVVLQIQENDPVFDRIIAAPRDGALRGLAAPSPVLAAAEPDPKPAPQPEAVARPPVTAAPAAAPASRVGPPAIDRVPAPPPQGLSSAALHPTAAAAPPAPQPLAPSNPPPYQPVSLSPQSAQPQYGRPPYTPGPLPYAEQHTQEPDLPLTQPASFFPGAQNASLDSAFAEPKRAARPALWISAAALVVIALVVALVWFVGGGDNKTAPQLPNAQSRNPAAPPVKTITPSNGTAAPSAETTAGADGETEQIDVPDPDSNGAVLFSFQLPANWEQTRSSACTSSGSSSTEGRSFRSAPVFFHSPSDPCAEVGISYEGIDPQATLQSVGENLRQQMGGGSSPFTNLQFAVIHGQNSFNSYDQPARDASWFLYVAPHKDSKLLVSIGCRNDARGSDCEKALQTLKVTP